MPLYEYRCKDCGSRFETLVAHWDEADTVTCKTCSGSHVGRLISGFATVGGYDDEYVPRQSGNGGGCCGGSCGCSH